MTTFDPEHLRTFLAFVDGGSLARAAEIVHRSPSAVTTQMQRLQDTVGEPLLSASGRGRALTPAGEELALHARRILALHRDAWLSLKGARADGRVAIGVTQDFAESGLPELIRAFAATHPRVRLELRIGRSGELQDAFASGAVDIAITMRPTPGPDEIAVLREPMKWLAAADGLVVPCDDLPLALLDPPCGFRSAAIAALEDAGRRYRITATSGSLAGLGAAVRGGIALTLRTARWMRGGIAEAPASLDLPPVADAVFSICMRQGATAPVAALAQIVREGLGAAG